MTLRIGKKEIFLKQREELLQKTLKKYTQRT